ncbi:MAG: GDP-mannose 4,6-dehydratase [Chloroflexota bacterium]
MERAHWQDKRVLITGCTGFLGSWLAGQLVNLGADVVGLIRDEVPQSMLLHDGTVNKIKIVHGELCDYPLLERTLAEYEIHTIFHLAAQTIVGIANRSPMHTFETNIRGTWMLLEAARQNPTVKAIVVASSEKAYGDKHPLPFVETMPLAGRHPYDVSKSCADLISQMYAHTYQLPVSVTRCSNLYGGGDLNWNRLLPGTIRSVLRGEPPIIRSDGTFKRDYLYVEDAVTGYLMIAEQLANTAVKGECYNFGKGDPNTALDVVNTIIKVSDHPHLEPVILNEVQNEIKDEYLSSQKAHKTLGWYPQDTLETGLAKTMSWYRQFLKI